MLILTRKLGESIVIGDNIVITLIEQRGSQIRVGIKAPKEVKVYREEIYLEILAQNKQAAETNISGFDLDQFINQIPNVQGTKVNAGKINMKKPEVIIKKSKKEDKE